MALDVADIIKVGAEIGLILNVGKWQLIAHDDVVVSDAVPCASISLHGWGGHSGQSSPPTAVLLSFTFILPPHRNGVRSHSRCGTES